MIRTGRPRLVRAVFLSYLILSSDGAGGRPHRTTHTHTANRPPVVSDANLNPALQADVEDDGAPAKRPTRKFKNLDKPWEDDSVDHWKQHSQGFTQ